MNSLTIHFRHRQISFNAKHSLFLLIYMLMMGYFLRTYLIWQSVNCLMGLMALLTVAQPDKTRIGNKRFAFWALFLALLSCFIQVRTLVFFGLISGVFFLFEQTMGRLNRLTSIVVLFMCPFFQYSMNIFSFPIRLWLTGIAGKLLSGIGIDTTVQGSVIICRGQDFLVDTACMGLKMLISSLLLSVVILSVYEKKLDKQLKRMDLILFISMVVLLNIIANLLRIVLIVQFAILPSSFFHDIVGLICFIGYVLLPIWLLVKWWVSRSHVKLSDNKQPYFKKPAAVFLHVLLIGSLFTGALLVEREGKLDLQTKKSVSTVPGFKAEALPNHTIKMESNNALVYIKKMEDFFTPDHNPMVCWRGSGFELSEVQPELIGGKNVYIATLRKNDEKLFTGWWFDNGERQTISQIEFRTDMLKGAPDYSLINITCASKLELCAEIKKMFASRTINKILK